MFNEEFYPTPKTLIKKMLAPYSGETWRGGINGQYTDSKCTKLEDATILEPSAGKGDILTYIEDSCNHYSKPDFYCIEENTDLQSILKEKGYPVIASDFLTYNENFFYDFIIMNPPFSNGDEHLLKALEIGKNTEIVCLLNAETIKNPHTKRREFLLTKLNDLGAEFEFLTGEFKQAERKTDVEVVIVRVKTVDDNSTFDYDFGDFEDTKVDFDFDVVNDQVARQDLIGNLNLRYEEVRKHYQEYLKAEAKFRHYKSLFLDGEGFHQEKSFELDSGSPVQRYNYLGKQMKAHMWRKVIKELDVEKYMSSKVLNNFEAFTKQQGNMAFTKENVASFFQMIMNNRVNIWDQAVEDVFDELTKYWKENRHHVEGWKTNDRFKINRKVIIPHGVRYNYLNYSSYDLKRYGDKFDVQWGDEKVYADIDKVLDYLSGKSTPYDLTIRGTLKERFNQIGKVYPGDKYDNKCESQYFKIKFFKKGTVHLEFKDKKLWDLFNLTACATKNWLPDDEKTKWEEEKRKKREARNKKEEEQVEQLLLEEEFQPTLF